VHLVQKLTSYEQRHPDIYQDKFKHQITLVDTEDSEDSGEEQEVAVAEWTQGGGGKSSVLQMGKAARVCKGFQLRQKQGRVDL
jgi:tRNA A37 threonylcarbamoyladenosine biosynthesis protein TsaE